MKFKEWWLLNEQKIKKISNFWLLPKKWKVILRVIIAAITAYFEDDSNQETAKVVSLKDINVHGYGVYVSISKSDVA